MAVLFWIVNGSYNARIKGCGVRIEPPPPLWKVQDYMKLIKFINTTKWSTTQLSLWPTGKKSGSAHDYVQCTLLNVVNKILLNTVTLEKKTLKGL